MQIPGDLAEGLGIRELPCGRWGYICDRLFCRRRCDRIDDHETSDHRCVIHADTTMRTYA